MLRYLNNDCNSSTSELPAVMDVLIEARMIVRIFNTTSYSQTHFFFSLPSPTTTARSQSIGHRQRSRGATAANTVNTDKSTLCCY
jgi:hypothetical protein